MAYHAHEPFGQDHVLVQLAIIATVIANSNRDVKRKKEPYEVKDFLPQLLGKEEESPQDLRAKIDVAMAMVGGKKKEP